MRLCTNSSRVKVVIWSTKLHLLDCLHKVKAKFTLEQAMKAQRESRGIALLFP